MLVRREAGVGYLDSMLWMPKQHIPVDGVKQTLTPVLSSDRSIEAIPLWQETEHHLLVPRCFYPADELEFPVVDCRYQQYRRTNIKSRIKLDHRPDPVTKVLKPNGKTVQRDAVNAMLAANGGILQMACGMGKTAVSLEVIAQLGVPAIVVIDNTQLLEQWRSEIADKLEVPDGVGLIQADKTDWRHSIVLATYQTLGERVATLPPEASRWFGCIVFEEGHHVAASTFCRVLPFCQGRRYLITATPTREDGRHVVYDFHVGPVVYKNLTPELTPHFKFLWTGFTLDVAEQSVLRSTHDRTGELHLKKLAGYFGRWRPRLDMIVALLRGLVSEGRRLLVLSESVDEAVNLMALWSGRECLMTDLCGVSIAEACRADQADRTATELSLQETLRKIETTKSDAVRKANQKKAARQQARLSEPVLLPTTQPEELDGRSLRKALKRQALCRTKLATAPTNAQHKRYGQALEETEQVLQRHTMAVAIEQLENTRRLNYVRTLLTKPADAGLLIGAVDPNVRLAAVKDRRILFSIAQFGREGLDSPSLDTVVVLELFSSHNILQQLLGRPSRGQPGKKEPLVIFLEDNIGPLIGMAVKLRRHLQQWPADEGGPFRYELEGHPLGQRRAAWPKRPQTF